jgi:hypothetical protein
VNERDYGDQTFCLVCGFDFGSTLNENNQDICPCCSAQIGYTFQFDGVGAKRYRKHWLGEGGKWSHEPKPKGWLLDRQLENVPEELL